MHCSIKSNVGTMGAAMGTYSYNNMYKYSSINVISRVCMYICILFVPIVPTVPTIFSIVVFLSLKIKIWNSPIGTQKCGYSGDNGGFRYPHSVFAVPTHKHLYPHFWVHGGNL
jgi:hypothetical protein